MKKMTRFFTALFGIIALLAIIVCSFASCGGDDDPDDPPPKIPAEYQNTEWSHKDGITIVLAQDKVTVTKADGTRATYSFEKTEEISGNTILHFKTNDNIAGMITIKDGSIVGVIFPFIGSKSGGWSDGPYFDSNLDEFKNFLSSKSNNTKDNPYSFALNISRKSDLDDLRDTLLEEENKNKYIFLDLSGSIITGILNPGLQQCQNITGITIPNSVTSIGGMAFYECTSLASVTIPNSVTSIEAGAFEQCTSLVSVDIPNSVTSIENDAFNGCTSLTSVTIPNRITSIEDDTFNYCESLASITIPNSVTSIGGMAFYECTNLVSVTFQGTIPNGNFDGKNYPYYQAFFGNLKDVFYATNKNNGTPGTYTTTAPVGDDSVWTKQ